MSLHKPSYWCEVTGIQIIDPDGWRREGDPSIHHPISFREFLQRASVSTCSNIKKLNDLCVEHGIVGVDDKPDLVKITQDMISDLRKDYEQTKVHHQDLIAKQFDHIKIMNDKITEFMKRTDQAETKIDSDINSNEKITGEWLKSLGFHKAHPNRYMHEERMEFGHLLLTEDPCSVRNRWISYPKDICVHNRRELYMLCELLRVPLKNPDIKPAT